MMILKTSRSNLSSNDQLSLDLPFAATKSLTARVGPTPVFTRGSTGTYFGPLIDVVGEGTGWSTIGIVNGRAQWTKISSGVSRNLFYTGTRWKLIKTDYDNSFEYFAAEGSEWRPDQANWSGSGIEVTTSSTYGIVRAAINEPRFDHTSAGVCRGLLIEESRTNSQRYSDDFSLWSITTAGGGSVTSNQTTAPDGSSNADLLAETATTAIHVISDQSILITSGTTYTISVFAKKGNGATASDFIQLCGRGDTFGATQFATFNISNGTVNSSSGGTASIQNFGNGWYRCVFVVTATSTIANSGMVIAFVGSTPGVRQPSYAGSTTSNIFIWGAQLEAGSFPTSYIPTTTGSVVRSADVCSISGANFTSFYKQSEGTFLSQVIRASTNLNAFIYHASDGSFFNAIDNRYNSAAAVQALMNVSNVNQLTGMASIAVTAGSSVKQSFAYKLNDCAYSVNGASPILDTSALIPTVSQMAIGNAFSGNFPLNGTIAAIRYYRKRLPNAKLQALTA